MDHELCNFRDDIVEYFKKGFDNLTNEDRDICSCLLSQYVDLDEAYQIAQDFKATKEALLKGKTLMPVNNVDKRMEGKGPMKVAEKDPMTHIDLELMNKI